MPLFWWLIFVHFLADFPLQTNRIYSLKLKRLGGIMLHASVFGVLAVIVSFPYWIEDIRILLFVIFLWLTHYYVDRFKLRINRITTHKTTTFMIDQLIHVALISMIFLVPHSTNFLNSNMIFESYYYNPLYVIIITGYVGATYVALVTRLIIREGNLTPKSQRFQFPIFSTCIWEMIERAVIATAIWLGGFYYFLLIISGVSLYIRYAKKIEDKYNLIISTILAIIIGLLVRGVIYLLTTYYGYGVL